jgi:hypothetical protein
MAATRENLEVEVERLAQELGEVALLRNNASRLSSFQAEPLTSLSRAKNSYPNSLSSKPFSTAQVFS